jgi:hypothetical protein
MEGKTGFTISNIVPSESLLKRFATFLMEAARSRSRNGKLISLGSALNYLSQVKRDLMERTKDAPMWKDAENG